MIVPGEAHRPTVTDDAVSRARALIGTPLRRRGLNTAATVQNIRRWALGIGDRNPLFLDPGYGLNSRYGAMIAPPFWLYSVDDTVVAPGMRGLHAFYAGARWEFFRPVRVGDAVTASARLDSVDERSGRFAGRTVRQTSTVRYRLADGRDAATCTVSIDRFGRREAAERALYMGMTKHRYTEDELLRIEDDYDAEEIRGDRVRYWEDTRPGDELAPVVKGPLTAEDIITFVTATHPILTYDAALRYRRAHPLAEFQDEETGRFDAWERAVLDPEVSRLFGFPLPHDVGYQRICWIGGLLTNWMGDDGFLRRLDVDVVRPNFHGDTTWCAGTATATEMRDGAPLVTCEVRCENQRGEVTARGRAEVQLQSRAIRH